MQENKPVLVVGLGNPGEAYKNTRHNVGVMAVNHFAGDGAKWKKEKNALTCAVDIGGRRVILVQPQTFMNNSGDAVGPLMAYYKIPLENVIVIHDDMDLAVGSVREKIGGGSAGHNGIKSIDRAVGADYKRIRIGVGHPRDLGLPMEPADWVLGRFAAQQLSAVESVIDSLILF
ncbi:MAG: aminoacyl-tRNA hydrolase [Alphaproteobacteria bacterium]|nr:aminoacyl-tRNA hydrolase [Alphaproteobacteria bacterium]